MREHVHWKVRDQRQKLSEKLRGCSSCDRGSAAAPAAALHCGARTWRADHRQQVVRSSSALQAGSHFWKPPWRSSAASEHGPLDGNGLKATRACRAAPLTLEDQLLSECSGACRSARRSCRSARRSCRFSTRAWWPTQAEKNVQAAVAAKVSRSARAIR